MDPLSMTASIVTVLELTTSLMSYLNSVKHATSDQKQVAIQASHLYSLLISLRYRVEAAHSNDPWFTQVKILGCENGPLDQFKKTLERIVNKTEGLTATSQVKSVLTWKFNKSEVEAAFTQIERLKSVIHIALSNDAFKLTQAIRDQITNLSTRVEDVHLNLNHIQTSITRDMQDKISRWLTTSDPSTNYNAALKKRHPGTGSWLLAGQTFQDWKASTSSFLWLFGKAGCGKTVLSATALEGIRKDVINRPEDSAISYFYFDFNDSNKQRSNIAIKSLLLQFAHQLPGGPEALLQLYQQCSNGRQQPSDDRVQLILYQMMQQAKRKYIILDAVDECDDRDELLTFLEGFVASQHKVHILATSRLEKDIDDSLRPIANHIINVESAVVNKDIDAYVRGRLINDQKLKKWPSSVKDEIAHHLQQKADGMFRWAYCQMESLQYCVQLRQLRAALSSLPRTLDETYTQIVEILAIQKYDDGESRFDPDERLPEPTEVLTICSSFISYNVTSDDKDVWSAATASVSDEGESTGDEFCNYDVTTANNPGSSDALRVRLAHFSVKEYLLSDRCSLWSEFQPKRGHAVIAEGCLHYLHYISSEAIRDKDVSILYPLSTYSANMWRQHFREVEDDLDISLSQLAYYTLTHQDTVLMWCHLCDNTRFRPAKDGSQGLDVGRLNSPLHCAAEAGLAQMTKRFVKEGVDINAIGLKHRSALQLAAANGHKQVIHILVDAGAEVNTPSRDADTALYSTSRWGYIEEVKILIAAGADVDAKGYYGTALKMASSYGHIEVVEILLAAGADVNVKVNYSTALQQASVCGHIEVVKVLLAAGADVNAEGCVGTPLYKALLQGHMEVVKVLLAAGADVNAEWDDGPALSDASSYGHIEVVEFLLAAGADVNAKGYYGTALQKASSGGHIEVVKVLLAAGADINAEGFNGTALYHASSYGHIDVVKVLLAAGADINAEGFNGTALYHASSYGHIDVVKVLLAAGADVNAKGHIGTLLCDASSYGHIEEVESLLATGADVDIEAKYGTALQEASSYGRIEVVKVLLAAGADVNAEGYNSTALYAASSYGHIDVVKVLLAAEADVNSEGYNSTALYDASSYGHIEVVKVLLAAGADVNIKANYGTALQKASSGGHIEVVKVLLAAGADVNAEGYNGIALYGALSKGHIEVVKVLLAAGADVNIKAKYGTALQKASSGGHIEVVKVLLAAGADVNAEGNNGTALQKASSGGHIEVVKVLLAAGADFKTDGSQAVAIRMASNSNHTEVADLLLAAGAANPLQNDGIDCLWRGIEPSEELADDMWIDTSSV